MGDVMTSHHHIELKPEHLSAIRALADEAHQPFDDVNRAYVEILETLDAHARIKDFVTLFTARQVRDRFRDTQH